MTCSPFWLNYPLNIIILPGLFIGAVAAASRTGFQTLWKWHWVAHDFLIWAQRCFFFPSVFACRPSTCGKFEWVQVMKMHWWPKALKVIRAEWKPFEPFLPFHVTPLFSEAWWHNGSSRFSCFCLKAISPRPPCFQGQSERGPLL